MLNVFIEKVKDLLTQPSLKRLNKHSPSHCSTLPFFKSVQVYTIFYSQPFRTVLYSTFTVPHPKPFWRHYECCYKTFLENVKVRLITIYKTFTKASYILDRYISVPFGKTWNCKWMDFRSHLKGLQKHYELPVISDFLSLIAHHVWFDLCEKRAKFGL